MNIGVGVLYYSWYYAWESQYPMEYSSCSPPYPFSLVGVLPPPLLVPSATPHNPPPNEPTPIYAMFCLLIELEYIDATAPWKASPSAQEALDQVGTTFIFAKFLPLGP